nr:hypothetical protein [Pseudomonas syringae group genomosp. 7]
MPLNVCQRALELGLGLGLGHIDQMHHRERQITFQAIEAVTGFMSAGRSTAQYFADLYQGVFEG